MSEDRYRYVSPAQLQELKGAWESSPGFVHWWLRGALPEELPPEMRNLYVTPDGERPLHHSRPPDYAPAGRLV